MADQKKFKKVSIPVTVDLDMPLYQDLKSISFDCRCSVSDLVRLMVAGAVNDYKDLEASGG